MSWHTHSFLTFAFFLGALIIPNSLKLMAAFNSLSLDSLKLIIIVFRKSSSL
ncbi:hypothetical protein HanPSC8_Chr10g0407081 [Helianthus annuus]|nr:hypothetical protein HanPSC8_Chr10g0407081 [Helianthus annuus]